MSGPGAPSGAPPADRRDARQLSPAENADLCAGCVKCCTYITVEVDSPRAAWEYDQWVWALHHEQINLYVEKPERWFLHFDTRCRQLQPDGRCAIYGRHPVLCREYDPRNCERRLPLADIAAWFHSPAEFEAWIRERRPRHWERLVAYRQGAGARPAEPRPAAGFVPLEVLAAARPARGAPTTNGVPRRR